MEKKDIEVIFENKELIAVNKPAGIAVHGGEGIKTTLLDILERQMGYLPCLLHRLDRDTSGIILLSKTKEGAAKYNYLFKSETDNYNHKKNPEGDKKTKKIYGAVCDGHFNKNRGNLTEDIKVKGIDKKALTYYTVIKNIGRFTLLELEILTGRMHQIRIHLSQSEHPVLGDDKYGNFKLNRELKKEYGLKHLLLFAKSLEITGGKNINISIEEPVYFKNFIALFDNPDKIQ